MVKIRNVKVAVALFPRNLLILLIKVGNVNIGGNEDFHIQRNVFVLYMQETVAAALYQVNALPFLYWSGQCMAAAPFQVKLLYVLIQERDSGYSSVPVEASVKFDKGCFSIPCKDFVFVDIDKRQRLLLCSK
jgi:hypothetical protein